MKKKKEKVVPVVKGQKILEKERSVNQFTDFSFKKLVGSESSKKFLICFLN